MIVESEKIVPGKGEKGLTEVENNGENEESDADDEDKDKIIKRLVKILKYQYAKHLIIIITMMVNFLKSLVMMRANNFKGHFRVKVALLKR